MCVCSVGVRYISRIYLFRREDVLSSTPQPLSKPSTAPAISDPNKPISATGSIFKRDKVEPVPPVPATLPPLQPSPASRGGSAFQPKILTPPKMTEDDHKTLFEAKKVKKKRTVVIGDAKSFNTENGGSAPHLPKEPPPLHLFDWSTDGALLLGELLDEGVSSYMLLS
jgi:hypothetical protein